MASTSMRTPSNPITKGVFCYNTRKHLLARLISNSSFFGRKLVDNSLSYSTSTSGKKTLRNRSELVRVSGLNATSESHSFDVVIVGAGVIGLTIARQFLIGSNLSVAVVDAAVPCSGATGAGQGYIWMIHKTPGSDKWELAMRSRKLWEMFAESIQHQGMNPVEILGWKKTGSLLVGRTADDTVKLSRTVEKLSEAGLGAKFLSSNDLLVEEPALMVGKEGGAAFLPDDFQLNARLMVACIEKANRQFTSEGRYAEFYYEPAISLLRSGSTGEVEGVQTLNYILNAKKAVVIAAGCWSGSLMQDLMRDSNTDLAVPVKPRKGHLLVIENFKCFKLNHGLMEVGYIDHEAATLQPSASDSGPIYHAQTPSISMAATMDTSGNLVLGILSVHKIVFFFFFFPLPGSLLELCFSFNASSLCLSLSLSFF
ncbi:unnamed protein product [Ilex paraguariensis]|uniref:FAD-dependent oxidoreductase domain-containing protein 1 n=1 Tax=Ilex paraguariensis TaxID=185542 RepID=A0ABC8TT78_9AQUA